MSWLASGELLGSIWEAPGEHLGGMGSIWAASGKRLGLQEALGLQKRLSCQVAIWESLGLRVIWEEFRCRGKHLGSIGEAPG